MSLITKCTGVLETQNESKQDFIIRGKLQNGNLWYAVFDGHGSNKVINAIRALDFLQLMEMKNPAREIETIIRKIPDSFNSGATMSIVIISHENIRCFWKGDSTIKIYKNDEEYITCNNHNNENETEVARVSKLGIVTKHSWRPEIISANKITMVPSPYFMLSFNKERGLWDQTNMTNCLGHNNLLGDYIEEKTIPLTSGDEWTVLVASDGFWDIVAPEDTFIQLMNDCGELTDFAKSRWNQDWTYIYPGHPDKITKFGPADDMAIGMWKGGCTEPE